jgi:uncharacterized membrane protein YqjE
MVRFTITMPDKMFDTFAGARGERPPPLTVVDEQTEAPLGSLEPPDHQQKEAAAQAHLFAVAALAAAASFAVVGLTTVVIAVAIPSHWLLALGFTGVFVLIAIATGLLAVWHVRTQPRGQRLQTLGMASRSAARAIRKRTAPRRGRRAG